MTFAPFSPSNAVSNPTVPQLPTLPNEMKLQIFQHIITSSLPPDGGVIKISPPPTTGLEVESVSKGLSTIFRLSRHWSFIIHQLVYESVVFQLSGRAMRHEFNRPTSYARLNLLSHWSYSPYISPHIKTIKIALGDGYWAFKDRNLPSTLTRFPNLWKVVFAVAPHPLEWGREFVSFCADTLDFVPRIEIDVEPDDIDVEPDPHSKANYRIMQSFLGLRNER